MIRRVTAAHTHVIHPIDSRSVNIDQMHSGQARGANDDQDEMPLYMQAALWHLQTDQAKLRTDQVKLMSDQAKLLSDQADLQRKADDLAFVQTTQCRKRALVHRTSERKRTRGDQRDAGTQTDTLEEDEFTAAKGTGPPKCIV